MLRSICFNVLKATALVVCVGVAGACYARGHVAVVDDRRDHHEDHRDDHRDDRR
jgi:hypothetical protein